MALLAHQGRRHWGYDLCKQAGVRSGTLYPMLHRWLDRGWLDDGWEAAPETGTRKAPPRRFYTVTPLGAVRLGAVAGRVQPARSARPFRTRSATSGPSPWLPQ